MTSSEKKIAVLFPRIAVAGFLVAVFGWFEILPLPEVIGEAAWRLVSFAILMVTYYSKKLYDYSKGTKVFDLIYTVVIFDMLFSVLTATADLDLNWSVGIIWAIYVYMIYVNFGDLFPIWGKAALFIMLILFLAEDFSLMFDFVVPEAIDFGWILGVPGTLLAFSYVYSKQDI